MKFTTVENSKIRRFDRLSIGDLFLSKDKQLPFIKTVDVTYYGDVYNCIDLGTGSGWNFQGTEEVVVPNNYELKIFF